MIKKIIDQLQELHGENTNVFYQKGNVYIDKPLEKKGKYFNADDIDSLLNEIFPYSVVQEVGNTTTLMAGDEYIEFTFNQKEEGMRTLSMITGASVNLDKSIFELIINRYLNNVHNRG